MQDTYRETRRTEIRETPVAHGSHETEIYSNGARRPFVSQIVYYLSGALLALLTMRFILSLLGANRDNAFADVIYTLSHPFVAPFFGLFGYEVRYGVARLEFETLIAMAVYALLAYGIARLIEMIMSRRHSAAV